jgi:hypothetical protein|eukprot:COSAG01_NODE_1385_length_10512_cov_9.464708_5_plen_85_part_00
MVGVAKWTVPSHKSCRCLVVTWNVLASTREVLAANGNAFAFGGWLKVDDLSSHNQPRVFDFGNGPGGDNRLDGHQTTRCRWDAG